LIEFNDRSLSQAAIQGIGRRAPVLGTAEHRDGDINVQYELRQRLTRSDAVSCSDYHRSTSDVCEERAGSAAVNDDVIAGHPSRPDVRGIIEARR
jgi:hypothetical protein